jgi:hypothetical protein
LAAAATADKGLSLSPEALEVYARAIEGRLEDKAGGGPGGSGQTPADGEPDAGGDRLPGVDSDGRGQQGAEGGGTSQDGKSQARADGDGISSDATSQVAHGKNQAGADGPDESGTGRPGPAMKNPVEVRSTEAISPENLQKKLESIEANSPLLAILNSLPGRNGQRWIVVPFKMETDTVEYRVSLRLLLYGEEASHCKAEQMVLDVEGWAKGGGTEPAGNRLSRWLFTLKKGGEPGACLDVRSDPPTADPEGLKNELEGLLGVYAGRIQVGTFVSGTLAPGTLAPEPLAPGTLAPEAGEYNFFPKIDDEVYY